MGLIKVTERGGNTGKREGEEWKRRKLQENATGATLTVKTNED